MEDDVLVMRQKGNKLKLKVSKRKKNQYSNPTYRKMLNPHDSNDLALLFADLKIWFNAPIEKAFKILKQEEEDLGKEFFLWDKVK